MPNEERLARQARDAEQAIARDSEQAIASDTGGYDLLRPERDTEPITQEHIDQAERFIDPSNPADRNYIRTLRNAVDRGNINPETRAAIDRVIEQVESETLLAQQEPREDCYEVVEEGVNEDVEASTPWEEATNTISDFVSQYEGVSTGRIRSSPQVDPPIDGVSVEEIRRRISRRSTSPLATASQVEGEDYTKHQRRLLAAVAEDGRLLFVRYEKNGNFHDIAEDHRETYFKTWLIRKCPPHIAQRLVDFDSTADCKTKGKVAWKYVKEAGLWIREC